MPYKISIPDEIITSKIFLARGQKVMIDRDLAELYGLETKRLKESVRRNRNRFPKDFMFQMNKEELQKWRSQFASSNPSTRMGLRYPPFCFTEYGILMLSSVLNTDKAIGVNIQIIKTFIHLRKLANNYDEIRSEMNQIESRTNEKFNRIYEVLERLLSKPQEKARTRIGFKRSGD